MQQMAKSAHKQKSVHTDALLSVNLSWCSIKNDYRTLADLEDVVLVLLETENAIMQICNVSIE